MNFSRAGQKVIVTGATSGIGQAIAIAAVAAVQRWRHE
jgi:NAD(P)-dependent dehydrogenase (short-subunit alcohol dehydrogenase family)